MLRGTVRLSASSKSTARLSSKATVTSAARVNNITLGNKRADAVRRYLIGLGVPEGDIQIVSYGKERPSDPGHTEAAWAKNRRAEFVWR